MRFLRLFTNSLLAGALGAAYLTILVLQLNPQVPLLSHTVWRWYATLGAFYGMHLALLFYVTMLLREFVSVDIFSPGWISVRLLAWLSAVAAAAAADSHASSRTLIQPGEKMSTLTNSRKSIVT